MMTISRDLFLSILALDSYNRGYNSGIHTLVEAPGSQIGAATLKKASGESGKDVGFYATAYAWNGETIISYRGTDNFGPFESDRSGASDIWTGWSLALGFLDNTQAAHAIAFYDDVVGQSVYDRAPASVVTTGHSLGGALAGFTAALSGAQAVLFDHEPFSVAAALQLASEAQRRGAAIVADPDTYEVQAEQAELEAIGLSLLRTAQIYGWFVEEELLVGVRSGENQKTVNAILSLFGQLLGLFSGKAAAGAEKFLEVAGLVLDIDDIAEATKKAEDQIGKIPLSHWGSDLNRVDLHSQNLLVLLMFARDAQRNGELTGDWHGVARTLLRTLFDPETAKALGVKKSTNDDPGTGEADESGQLRSMIAYSAIDDGFRPFGDSAIRALFNDADELGKVYAGAVSYYLSTGLIEDRVQQGLAEIAVQYAGELALQKATDDASKTGVYELLDGGARIKADLDPEKWVATFNVGLGGDGNNRTGGQEKIVGLTNIVDGLEHAELFVLSNTLLNDKIKAAFAQFRADAGAGYRNITWLEAAAGDAAVTIAAPDNAKPLKPGPGGAILIGGGGAVIKSRVRGGEPPRLHFAAAGNDNRPTTSARAA
ncbi:MAG: hypothetical protein ABL908_04445 [Hyphomicrobium sp.]